MRTFKFAVFVAAVSVTMAVQVAAHHSFAAMYDGSRAVRITGKLTKIEWSNPHSYFYLDVTDENGKVINWACEGAAPGALSRRGFQKGDIKFGDTLIIDGYRARDGSNLMDARRVILPDGRVIAGGSEGDGGPQESKGKR
ncbi:MAG: DUF6152 family protein [Acidobacteriota bacterium]